MAKFDITKFAEALPDRADLPDSGMTREIPVGDILDNPRNFYPRPDNKALVALMESIQANGLLEPPTVVPAEDGKYRLISGHSRMAALRLLAANRDEAVAKQFSTVLCRVPSRDDGGAGAVRGDRGEPSAREVQRAARAGGGEAQGELHPAQKGRRGVPGRATRLDRQGDADQRDEGRQFAGHQKGPQGAGHHRPVGEGRAARGRRA